MCETPAAVCLPTIWRFSNPLRACAIADGLPEVRVCVVEGVSTELFVVVGRTLVTL